MKKYIAVLFLSIFALYSCENVLDFSPTNQYNEFTVWKSKENMKLYMNSFYVVASTYGQFGDKAFGSSHHSTDGLTYMLKYSSSITGNGTPNVVAMTPDIISADQNALGFWANAYTQIRRINEFLVDVDAKATVLNDAEKLEFKAEARFLRAWWYFLLVRSHGSVIIYDDLGDWKNSAKARSSEKDCWDYVEKELNFCGENLPEVRPSSDFGRPTKGASYGLMTRAMLYAKRYDAVVGAFEKMAGLGYDLEGDYAKLFKLKAGQTSVESIFQVDYVKGAVVHKFDSRFAPSGDIADQGGLVGPTQEMVDAYEMADGSAFDWNNPVHAANPYANREPRFYKSVLYNGAPWKGRVIETFVGGADGYKDYNSTGDPKTTVTGYYVRKMLDESNNTFNLDNSYQSFIAIRYAEVLLNYAEALILNDKVAFGISQLNKVRGRAGLSGRDENVGKDQAMAFVCHERLIELAFEGFHYWDLRRWKLSVEQLHGKRFHGMKITKAAGGSYNYEIVPCDDRDRVFPEKYYTAPIPTSEISNNPLCTQLDEWK